VRGDGAAALDEVNLPLPPGKRIGLCIGIHVGDVMVGGGDLFGDAYLAGSMTEREESRY